MADKCKTTAKLQVTPKTNAIIKFTNDDGDNEESGCGGCCGRISGVEKVTLKTNAIIKFTNDDGDNEESGCGDW